MTYRYKRPAFTAAQKADLLSSARKCLAAEVKDILSEYCFYIEAKEPLSPGEMELLRWLLSETFEPENFSEESFLSQPSVIEVGPRMNFTTAWSTNAVSVCHSCGLAKITRIERSRKYKIVGGEVKNSDLNSFLELLYDRMTECPYPKRLETFETGIKPEPYFFVPLITEGRQALERINREMGLGLDEWDMEYYYSLFVKDIGRDPTNVECFDLSQ